MTRVPPGTFGMAFSAMSDFERRQHELSPTMVRQGNAFRRLRRLGIAFKTPAPVKPAFRGRRHGW